MKTAMQELKEWLIKMPKVPISRDLLISKILIGEETEKQQIIDAFIKGDSEIKALITEDPDYEIYLYAQDYYNNTFKGSHKQ